MGSLNLPSTGSVYVDANAVIYAVEKIAPYDALLDPVWHAAKAGQFQIVSSELTWLETLTAPLRDGNTALEALFRAFLSAPEVRLVPATLALWESAARLRSLRLRTPDALHAATAHASGCDLLLSNDPVFQRVPGLNVAVLSEVLAAP